MHIEADSFWHQDMQRLPPGDEGTSVIEVRVHHKAALREVLETVLLTLVVVLAGRMLVQNYRVEGESMLPTLLNEQYVLVDKVSYLRWDANLLPRLLGQSDLPADVHYLLGHGPQRGDIIVLHAWHETKDYIKRVIGLPGDQVEIRANDHVYINGVPLTEPYILATPNYDVPLMVVPPDDLYVLGDNRRNSSDSHVSTNGPIPLDRVVGRAWFSYWPPATFGPIAQPSYAQ